MVPSECKELVFDVAICIPTYNRIERLKLMLEALINDVQKINSSGKRIQVVVSDNCSVDGTYDYLSDMQEKHNCLTIGRNVSNIGFARNLFAVSKLAKSKFLYFIGDDDFLREGALSILLEASLMKSNLVIFDSKSSNFYELEFGLIKKGLLIEDLTISSYFKNLGLFKATFIGNIMIERDSFVSTLTSYGDFIFESAYVHMYAVFDMLANGCSKYCDYSLVKEGDDMRSWQVNQPVLTSIDLARVISNSLNRKISLWTMFRMKLYTAKSLPRALYYQRKGILSFAGVNSHNDLSIRNIYSIYFCWVLK